MTLLLGANRMPTGPICLPYMSALYDCLICRETVTEDLMTLLLGANRMPTGPRLCVLSPGAGILQSNAIAKLFFRKIIFQVVGLVTRRRNFAVQRCMYMYMYMYMYACMYVCMYVCNVYCMHVCMCVLSPGAGILQSNAIAKLG